MLLSRAVSALSRPVDQKTDTDVLGYWPRFNDPLGWGPGGHCRDRDRDCRCCSRRVCLGAGEDDAQGKLGT